MHTSLILALGLAWVAILAGGWLGWQLLRQNGRLLLRIEALEEFLNELELGESPAPTGLPIGSPAAEFELPDLTGETKSLSRFRGQPLLLVFFNPACGYCQELAPNFATLNAGSRRGNEADGTNPQSNNGLQTSAVAASELPQVIVITTGGEEKNREFFHEHKVNCPVLLQKDAEVATAYQANGTPSGYLINAEGKIASELAMGPEALLALANGGPHPQPLSHPMGEGGQRPGEGDPADPFAKRSLARGKIKRDGLKAGTPAPDFRLPRLDGRGELSLEGFRGRRVLLVFSSPNCGPCSTLAPELEKFHRQYPELEVVMISKGEPKENRAKIKEHGLTFPVVLQQQWEISRRYAMFATPIAYMVDQAGVISHDVTVGVESIQTLMAQIMDERQVIYPTG